MPNKRSAIKQLRKDRRRQARNTAVRSELRTVTKRLTALLGSKDVEQAQTLLRKVASQYDRATMSGVIHRNTAQRQKSRLTRRLSHVKSAS